MFPELIEYVEIVKTKEIIEYGDFQTPVDLACEVIRSLKGIADASTIIEPTCGLGSFLSACIKYGLDHNDLIGWEINPLYVETANITLSELIGSQEEVVVEQDFFSVDWSKFQLNYESRIAFIGNPPWVTNSELGKLLSKNLPEKMNFQGLTGLDAITGKSNFDISEWMLIKLLNVISQTSSSIHFLIKTSVARKLFEYVSKNKLAVRDISIKGIDAKKHFNVSVDACLFEAYGTSSADLYKCSVYSRIGKEKPDAIMGIVGDKLVADIESYNQLSFIDGNCEFKWRSGVKHDASKVMEFDLDTTYINGFKELVDIEHDFLYPMYKSSNISKESLPEPKKYMLVTQKKIGDETKSIELKAPKTWEYLLSKSEKLDNRKSSIYKNSPRFSVFGVGDYTFSNWKVVISGFYKNFRFKKVGMYEEKPIVLDDTCCMIGLDSEEKADFLVQILNSDKCLHFIKSIVFLDSKRPITVALLNRINFRHLAIANGMGSEFDKLFDVNSSQYSLDGI